MPQRDRARSAFEALRAQREEEERARFAFEQLRGQVQAEQGVAGGFVPSPEGTTIPMQPEGFGSTVQGFLHTAVPNPFELAQLAGSAIREPVATAKSFAGGLAEMQEQAGERGAELFAQGRPSEAIGQTLAGTFPLSLTGAQIPAQSLDAGRPWRAAGETLGLLSPFATQRFSRMLPRPASARLPDVQGVEMLRSELGGRLSPMWAFAEGLVSKTIPGKARFQKFQQTRQGRIVDEITDEMVKDISTYRGTDWEVGRNYQAAMEKGLESFREAMDEDFGELDRIANPVGVEFDIPEGRPGQRVLAPVTPVNASRHKAVARAERRLLREVEGVIEPETLAAINRQLDTIIQGPDQLTFRQAQTARSILLEIARNHGVDPLPGRRGGISAKMAAAFDSEMEDAARRMGGDPLVEKWRDLNRQYKEGVEFFNDSFLRKMAEVDPEKVAYELQRAPLQEIAQLKANIPEEIYNQMAARLSRRWFQRYSEGELPTEAQLAPGSDVMDVPEVRGAQGPGAQSLTEQVAGYSQSDPLASAVQFKGAQYRRFMEKMMESGRLPMIFGERRAREMMDIARLGERVERATGQDWAGLIAGNINRGLLMAVPTAMVAAATGSPGLGGMALGGAAMTGAGLKGLSVALTTRPGAAAVQGMLKAMANNNVKNLAFWSARLDDLVQSDDFQNEFRRVLAAEQELQPGVVDLRDPLRTVPAQQLRGPGR